MDMESACLLHRKVVFTSELDEGGDCCMKAKGVNVTTIVPWEYLISIGSKVNGNSIGDY